MANIHIDHLDVLRQSTYLGVVRALTREILVTNTDENDYKVLYRALDDAGIVSVYGRAIEIDDYGRQLVLVDSDVSLYNKAKNQVKITQNFRHVLDGPYQDLENGISTTGQGGGPIYGHMASSLQQTKTNQYPTYNQEGQITGYTAITVEHTPEANSGLWPSQVLVQGGEINVFVPDAVYTIQGWRTLASHPRTLEKLMLGAVNSEPFLGDPVKTWICSDVRWHFIGREEDTGFNRYEMQFEFQYNDDTWEYPVVFIDPETNRPPEGLVEGVGKKTIAYHNEIDFHAQFQNARFENQWGV